MKFFFVYYLVDEENLRISSFGIIHRILTKREPNISGSTSHCKPFATRYISQTNSKENKPIITNRKWVSFYYIFFTIIVSNVTVKKPF